MPQRPGSSKPMQKGGLLDDDKPSSTTAASVGKRPESPVNKKGVPKGKQNKTSYEATAKARMRSASPVTLLQNQKSNKREDSVKGANRKMTGSERNTP